jgi:endonuclease-3
MRSSRVSRDTAKLLDKVSSPPSPPRRTTRSSLARFAYTATTTAVASQQQNGAPAPDVEDIFTAPAKKRRRVASTTSPVKVIKTELVEDAVSVAETKAAARRVRKPARKVTNATTGEVKVEPPSDWEEIYGLIRQMRAPGGAAHGAAVDTMGCERLADRSASEKDQRFHTLVALMLSSQTKDTVNAVAMKRLQTELPPYKEGAPVGLNLDNMLAVDPKLLNEMIWAVGFHNNKTKYETTPFAA